MENNKDKKRNFATNLWNNKVFLPMSHAQFGMLFA